MIKEYDPKELKVSVVIPLYNKEATIVKTIRSVLNQPFLNFEIIIIDDGSTDSSVQQVESFRDERIKIYSIENAGVSNARNMGVSKSKNEYIYFLDADDIIDDNCFEVFNELYHRYPNERIYCTNFGIYDNEKAVVENYCSIDFEGVLSNPFYQMYKGKFFTRTGTMLISKSSFRDAKGFDIRFSYYEDMDFIFRLIGDSHVIYSNKNVFKYTVDNCGLSSNVANKNKNWLLNANCSSLNFYQKKVLSVLIFDCIVKCILERRVASLLGIFKEKYRFLPSILLDKLKSKL